jgi:hypothetical protein
MMRVIHCDRRLLVVLLLLCVMVLAQSSAVSAERESHHSPDHCCLLCHVGPMPFLQTSVPVTIAPAVHVEWLAPNPEFESVHDVLLATSYSRGPPA